MSSSTAHTSHDPADVVDVRAIPTEAVPGGDPLGRSSVRGPAKASFARRVVSAIAPILSLVVLLGIWQWASSTGRVSHLVLPKPTDIGSAFIDLFSSSEVWPHLRVTTYETVLGFFFGAGLAFILAVLSSFWQPFRAVVSPYMVALQVTPRVALAPIFITWFGFGTQPKIIMAATICFFPVFINTLTGLMARDEQTLEMFRSMGASKTQIFKEFTLPAALPITFAGLKTGITLALIGAIVGEFVATSEGLGHLIERYTFRLAMDYAFAVLFVLMAMGLLLYGLMDVLDRKIVFWTDERRLARHGRFINWFKQRRGK